VEYPFKAKFAVMRHNSVAQSDFYLCFTGI